MTLQQIYGRPEALAGYERWREKIDALWGQFNDQPSIKVLDDIRFAFPSEDRAHAFMFAFERVRDDSLFWGALAKWWASFDMIDQAAPQRADARPSCRLGTGLHD